jgi:hypothetical protein
LDKLSPFIKAGLTTAHVLVTTFVIGSFVTLLYRMVLDLFLPLPLDSVNTYHVSFPANGGTSNLWSKCCFTGTWAASSCGMVGACTLLNLNAGFVGSWTTA